MIIGTINNSPVRTVKAKVELYNGSTLVETYSYNDALISFDIERLGEESKFFGFGICQKINIKLRDLQKLINISTANSFKVWITTNEKYITPYPMFYVTEVHRDEITNELSITAYDKLYKADTFTVPLEEMFTPYTIEELLRRCAYTMGLEDITTYNIDIYNAIGLEYQDGANLEGTENIRAVLNAAAEATQSIYYLAGDSSTTKDYLVYRRMDNADAPAALTIGKADYFTLESKTNRKLTTITHTTELGDNHTATTGEIGTTQYIRDNPFLELREDIEDLLAGAIAAIGGFTINQFTCSWRGNYLLEIGDKIELITKDGSSVFSYVINDTISYSGGLSEQTSWNYAENDSETESTPTNIGEAIKQTYAKVDRANKQIELVASETADNTSAISSLQVDTEGIAASIQEVETITNEALGAINENIETITNSVSAKMGAEEVIIAIQTELANGVDKVTTATGFTLNDEGLTVSKTDSEMKTTITEDGMTVYKNNEAVLTANNVGVDATNLHATTYLIIGTNSRFENFGSGRTGCFWIGE